MSFITKVYNWPAQDLSAVAAAQSVSAGGSLILNGTLSSSLPGNGYIDFPGICRQLTITLSSSGSATFSIQGLRNGNPITESLPISGTSASSLNYFDTITSIICTSAPSSGTVTVGTGPLGMTRPLMLNSFLTDYPLATAIYTDILSGSTGTPKVTYSVIGSILPFVGTSILFPFNNVLYLNQGTANSVSGQYTTSTPATDTSFITTEGLPLTVIAVVITTSNPAASLSITITTPRLVA